MSTVENVAQETPETVAQARPSPPSVDTRPDRPVRVDPDLDFIRRLERHGGDALKMCIQCGTCAGTCTLTPDRRSFPCKEVAWAAWGMKDRLLEDPDVWLCYQCHDCSTRCPRGVRPGDVLGAIRQECVKQYATPRFLGRWVNQPQGIPLLLGIPAALLSAALYFKEPLENSLGIVGETGERIVYSYSSVFPHWLLNSFFGFFSLLVLLAVVVGGARFWRAMKNGAVRNGFGPPVKGRWSSIVTTVGDIFTHKDFASCEASHTRTWSHVAVFFGFLALSIVTLWIITSGINPLLQKDFIYPFAFWSPWKMLANVGGLALLGGVLWMIYDRLRERDPETTSSYFDWALIATLLAVLFTGFFTEVLHYVRLEPHRHLAYFVHLVFVFALLIYLPYSKLAHVVYRTLALIFAERYGRDTAPHAAAANEKVEREEAENVEAVS